MCKANVDGQMSFLAIWVMAGNDPFDVNYEIVKCFKYQMLSLKLNCVLYVYWGFGTREKC